MGGLSPEPERQVLPGPSSPQGTARHSPALTGRRKCYLLLSPGEGIPGRKPESQPLQQVGKVLFCPSPLRPTAQERAGGTRPTLWTSAACHRARRQTLTGERLRHPARQAGADAFGASMRGGLVCAPPPYPGPRQAGDRSFPTTVTTCERFPGPGLSSVSTFLTCQGGTAGPCQEEEGPQA